MATKTAKGTAGVVASIWVARNITESDTKDIVATWVASITLGVI